MKKPEISEEEMKNFIRGIEVIIAWFFKWGTFLYLTSALVFVSWAKIIPSSSDYWKPSGSFNFEYESAFWAVHGGLFGLWVVCYLFIPAVVKAAKS